MSVLLGNIVLSVECDEPSGKITRHIRPLRMTQENLYILYNKFKQFKTIIGKEFSGDFKQFCTLFLTQNKDGSIDSNGIFWIIDDFVGIFYITDIEPGIDCRVHYSFFDRRHKGRVNLINQMTTYIFNTFGFQRITAKIPLYAKPSVLHFTEARLGYTKEGRMRQAERFDGKWFDVNIYGLLREEHLNASKA